MITTDTSGFSEVLAELTRDLEQYSQDEFITVGIHESAGDHDDSALTNAQLGALLHFGTSDSPARPWLDVGLESSAAVLSQTIADSLEDGEPLDQILNRMGVVSVAGIQQYMTALSSPPNSPETIRRKGSANPLIDSGEVRSSITFVNVGAEPTEGL